MLEQLRALGVKVAIDDFGTGYSVLSSLQRFPVDRIKMDRSFVERIGWQTGEAPIVAAMITMGHGLGLEVVAEGMAIAEQARTSSSPSRGATWCRDTCSATRSPRRSSSSSSGGHRRSAVPPPPAPPGEPRHPRGGVRLVSSETGSEVLCRALLGELEAPGSPG